MKFTIRKILPNDVEFLLKTWMRDYRKTAPRQWPDKHYYQHMQKRIVRLQRSSEARIACLPEDYNFIAGFAVGKWIPEPAVLVLHYTYVRPEFRKLGLARAMCEDLGYDATRYGAEIVATHWTEHLRKMYKPYMIHDPSLLEAE